MTWEQEMKIQAKILGQEIGQKIGQEIGEEIAEKKAIETAKNFLHKNIPAETVAECTGLPLEDVLKLQKEI